MSNINNCLCNFCGSRAATIDIEVINLSEEDVLSIPACLSCAHQIVCRTNSKIMLDEDDLAYATIGVVGGSPEEVN